MSSTAHDIDTKRSRVVTAIAIGNFIEWFEFGLYGYFAVSISTTFFSGTSEGTALVSTFMLFGIAFVSRPIGAILFGRYGDRAGRRGALSISIIGMSIATALIGAIPGDKTFGLLAPALLLVMRLAQGFFAGAEMGGAVTALAEYAPPGRRGFYSGWNGFTQLVAQVFAALIGTLLSSVLTPAALNGWGWRLPFLVALPLGLVGLYMRTKLAESPEFTSAGRAGQTTHSPVRDVLRLHWRALLKVCGLTVGLTTTTYMLVGFFPSYLVKTAGLTSRQMFTAMLIGLTVAAVLVPIWARLSDAYGRKPFLVGGALAVTVLTIPVFHLAGSGSFTSALTALVIVAVLLSPMLAVQGIAAAELFPTAVRYTGVSIGISVIISLMGGSTPLILQALVQATGSSIVPAVYITTAAALSLIAALTLKNKAEPATTQIQPGTTTTAPMSP
ncbi:MFS transporter [Amycolatopsis sp. WAC 01375]|uniref:MFS transporter n=1 Tax=unclassified Amycolatopsis TaxID=2618356 RepID=UPI000F7A4B4C|nr:MULTISPECIES: MFS transporter [unclassified Amycolatopsis]RSM75749.1 MFS transporter [Amycolatopsis sp. WAC 01375]RSN26216.1 MFS transporter [Amycolatopsis sp. WAC 01416]